MWRSMFKRPSEMKLEIFDEKKHVWSESVVEEIKVKDKRVTLRVKHDTFVKIKWWTLEPSVEDVTA